jgi:tetratricopeptide (TPR) repeat protein
MWQGMAVLWLAGVSAGTHDHGVDLYKHQKYTEAISTLEEAVKAETPGSSEYRESALLIGQSYFMLSQAQKAIPWLEKLPGVNEANYMLGYAYLETAQPDRSEAAFARLFGLNPASAAGHLLAGQMMLKKEFRDEAVAEVKKALALEPKLPQANFLLAEVEIVRGQLEEAITLLTKELGIDPNFSMAWYRLGDVYSRQQHWDQAIPHLQRAVWLNPSYSGPYILLGKCYYNTQNYSNAEGILRRALTLDPNNYAANFLLGRTLIAEGHAEEGRALLEKLKSLTQP